MPAAALPYIGAGLGIYSTLRQGQLQNQAMEEARKPRLSPEQQQTLRSEGQSSIQSSLAARGLSDSSLLPGGLAQLEKGIGEATANAGTQGDVSGMLSQQAMGQGQNASGIFGGLAEMYMMNKLSGGQGGFQNPFGQRRQQQSSPQFPSYAPYQQYGDDLYQG